MYKTVQHVHVCSISLRRDSSLGFPAGKLGQIVEVAMDHTRVTIDSETLGGTNELVLCHCVPLQSRSSAKLLLLSGLNLAPRSSTAIKLAFPKSVVGKKSLGTFAFYDGVSGLPRRAFPHQIVVVDALF
eukprot:521288-Amphidinium_carterae.1